MAIGLPGGIDDRRRSVTRGSVSAPIPRRGRDETIVPPGWRGETRPAGGSIVPSRPRGARGSCAAEISRWGRGGSTVGNAPRREELDEGGLAALENLGVEVGGGEIDGAGVSAEHQAHEGDREERDTHLDQDLREEWGARIVSRVTRIIPAILRQWDGVERERGSARER